MSTILATKLFQARGDSAIATSKLLLENLGYELLNAPINATSLFSNKIKDVTKSNYKMQQQRFLASSSNNTNQQQKASYLATRTFKIPKQRISHLGLSSLKHTGLKLRPSPLRPVLERTLIRGAVTPNSSPPLNKPHPSQSSECQPFPLPIFPHPDIPVGERLAHFVEQWGELTNNKWVLSII